MILKKTRRSYGIVTILIILILGYPSLSSPVHAASADDFVITVNTTTTYAGSSSDTQFTIPAFPGETYNYNVDCDNNGTNEANGVTGDYTCNYDSPGIYTVAIKDNTGSRTGFPRIYFNNSGDRLKLLTVEQWGTGAWTSMENAFFGAANLAGQASDVPDLSNVSSLYGMFYNASSFNGDISGWNTGSVTDMSAMFYGASAFNQDISGWDTSNVEYMVSTFAFATAFNQDLGQWEVGQVTSMTSTFNTATSFNQDLSGWDTGNVISFNFMFSGATAFDQDLGDWDVTSLTAAANMFSNVTLSTVNYDSLLQGWNAQDLTPLVSFSAGNSNYCLGENARKNMVISDGWTITDGGKDCSALDPFVITIKTDLPGTSGNNEFTIPTFSGEIYNYNVDCDNDGTDETTGETGGYTCSYAAPGTYTIRIKDNSGANVGFPRIYFNNSGDKDKLLSIDQWGTGQWSSMGNAFYGASNLAGQAWDAPDLTNVKDLSRMFRGASSFNQDLRTWQTSTIQSMSEMFYSANIFNQDISSWDTASVKNMSGMFANASSFNQDIGSWNTENVRNMDDMFADSGSFNQDISEWNTTNLQSAVGMFNSAVAFDQNLGGWDISSLRFAEDMFKNMALSTPNYDGMLIGWGAQSLQPDVTLDGGNSVYCDAAEARLKMINTDGWIITDGGQDCPTNFSIFLPLIIH